MLSLLSSLQLPQPLWLWIIIAGLATWRLTLIIHQEKIGKPLRRLIGVREWSMEGDPEIHKVYPDTFFGQLVECFMCLSVWVGLLVLALLLIAPVVLIPFAISAAAICIQLLVFER